MRMQSILVRPYVLDCLSRFEQEAKPVAKDEPQAKQVESGKV